MDLDHLTHQQKAKLLQKLDDMKQVKADRIRERALENYKPHAKQKLFHENWDKTFCMFLGGNQTGKTTGGLADDLADVLGYEPWSGKKRKDPPISIKILGEDYPNHVSDVLIPKLMELCPKDIIAKIEKIQGKHISKIYFKNGSVMKFMVYEQDPSKFAGSTDDVVHFDEPPPREIYIEVLRGILAKGGRMKFTMTAIKEAWIKEEIIDKFGPDRVFTVKVHMDDNPYLSDELKEVWIAAMDPEERKARIDGDFLHLGGSIYKGYKPEEHVIPRDSIDPTQLPCGIVVDPHDRKPFYLAWFCVTSQDQVVFFREWPDWDLFHKIKSHENTLADYIRLIHDTEEDEGIADRMTWRYIDPNSGNKRNAVLTEGESFVDLFAMGDENDPLKYPGLYFDYEIKDNIAYGHKIVKEALKTNSVFFTDNLKAMPYAMQNYAWSDFKKSAQGIKQVPQEKYKDPCDGVRYVLVKDPRFVDTSAEIVFNYNRSSLMNSGLGR